MFTKKIYQYVKDKKKTITNDDNPMNPKTLTKYTRTQVKNKERI